MLTERKRFNYMVNNSHHTSVHKKQYSTLNGSSLKNSAAKFPEETNYVQKQRGQEEKENQKKIQELEFVNKKLVDETARQFKKLEEDVQRVEKILEEKEQVIENNKKVTEELKEEVYKVNEEKKILIEAIFEKDMVIKEYEARLKQMIEQNAQQQQNVTPQKIQGPECEDSSMQTEPLPESCPIEKMASVQQQNYDLEDEVFRLKEELFDSTNKVKLLTQEFQAFKILKQIENIQEN